jgi:hypothetical protein
MGCYALLLRNSKHSYLGYSSVMYVFFSILTFKYVADLCPDFLLGRLTILIAICSLTVLLLDAISQVAILAL